MPSCKPVSSTAVARSWWSDCGGPVPVPCTPSHHGRGSSDSGRRWGGARGGARETLKACSRWQAVAEIGLEFK